MEQRACGKTLYPRLNLHCYNKKKTFYSLQKTVKNRFTGALFLKFSGIGHQKTSNPFAQHNPTKHSPPHLRSNMLADTENGVALGRARCRAAEHKQNPSPNPGGTPQPRACKCPFLQSLKLQSCKNLPGNMFH